MDESQTLSPLLIDQFAVGVAIMAVLMCGGTLIRSQLLGLVVQALCLVAICGQLSREEHSVYLLLLTLAMLIVKAIGIPAYLHVAAKRMGLVRDKGASLHPALALMISCGLMILGYALIPLFEVPALLHPLSAGMAVTLIFIGMFLMISRKLAVSQVIGFLTLENGISLYGLTQTRNMPLVLEMAIVFEVLVGVLIAVLVIFRVSRFEHVDAAQLRGLRH
jgi:hydrogenase-4 component E